MLKEKCTWLYEAQFACVKAKFACVKNVVKTKYETKLFGDNAQIIKKMSTHEAISLQICKNAVKKLRHGNTNWTGHCKYALVKRWCIGEMNFPTCHDGLVVFDRDCTPFLGLTIFLSTSCWFGVYSWFGQHINRHKKFSKFSVIEICLVIMNDEFITNMEEAEITSK